jgi:DNA-binding NarL/FixJ family response regulator
VCADAFLDSCRSAEDLNILDLHADAALGLETIVEARPDVTVIDHDIRNGGFELAAQLSLQLRHVKHVFIVKQASDICIQQALVMNAWGILLKQEPLAALVRHIQCVARGEHRFSEAIARRLSFDLNLGNYRLKGNTLIESLNSLQLQVLRHLARGDSIKMVAQKMGLSYKSVDGHKNRLMKKIGLHDRVLLSRFAVREGLVEP